MGDTDLMTIWWTYTEIKELHLRWYQLRDNALEIFLTNGKTLLLGFDNTEVGSPYNQMNNNAVNLQIPNELTTS